MSDERQILAVFIDFENLALGLKDRDAKFDIRRVLARLVEKGGIVVKRAYADWHRFGTYAAALHEAAIELIEIPRRSMTGKNSADMRLCVDAMDLCYSKEHINTFVILSGDSDFSPLVSKLKENGKQVIGLGMRDSTSDLLRDNCHEFIYYEDLKSTSVSAELQGADEREKDLFSLLLESLEALRRENRDTLWSSLVKETMKRKRPSFNEAAYGYKSFSRLLEDAARRGLVELDRDGANRTHIVARFGAEVSAGDGEKENGEKRRVRKRRPRRKSAKSVDGEGATTAVKPDEDV
ncbi:MAG TPA: NYN domain-containing protein [Pirellulales bacterium]|nr:NYN domain-containing protein [Pirellulales bacterium]